MLCKIVATQFELYCYIAMLLYRLHPLIIKATLQHGRGCDYVVPPAKARGIGIKCYYVKALVLDCYATEKEAVRS